MVSMPVPTAGAVYVTQQLAEAPLPVSVQLELLNVPAPLLAKPTVPVGVLFVPGPESLTVAVQLVEVPSGTVAGVQPTLVLVGRLLTVTVVDPELPGWAAAPL